MSSEMVSNIIPMLEHREVDVRCETLRAVKVIAQYGNVFQTLLSDIHL